MNETATLQSGRVHNGIKSSWISPGVPQGRNVPPLWLLDFLRLYRRKKVPLVTRDIFSRSDSFDSDLTFVVDCEQLDLLR